MPRRSIFNFADSYLDVMLRICLSINCIPWDPTGQPTSARHKKFRLLQMHDRAVVLRSRVGAIGARRIKQFRSETDQPARSYVEFSDYVAWWGPEVSG